MNMKNTYSPQAASPTVAAPWANLAQTPAASTPPPVRSPAPASASDPMSMIEGMRRAAASEGSVGTLVQAPAPAEAIAADVQLSDEQQAFCRNNHLTERHARAVLRLEEAQRLPALEAFAKQGMNARQADEYVQRLVQRTPRKKSIPMVRDVRIFVNTINKAVRLMVDAGVPAHTTKREGEGFVEYTVHIPTEPAKKTAASGAGCSA